MASRSATGHSSSRAWSHGAEIMILTMGEAMVCAVKTYHYYGMVKINRGNMGKLYQEKKSGHFGAFLARLRPESAPWNEAWEALEHCGHCGHYVPRHVEQPCDCPTAQKNQHIYKASVKNEITRPPHHWICFAAVKRHMNFCKVQIFSTRNRRSLCLASCKD